MHPVPALCVRMRVEGDTRPVRVRVCVCVCVCVGGFEWRRGGGDLVLALVLELLGVHAADVRNPARVKRLRQLQRLPRRKRLGLATRIKGIGSGDAGSVPAPGRAVVPK